MFHVVQKMPFASATVPSRGRPDSLSMLVHHQQKRRRSQDEEQQQTELDTPSRRARLGAELDLPISGDRSAVEQTDGTPHAGDAYAGDAQAGDAKPAMGHAGDYLRGGTLLRRSAIETWESTVQLDSDDNSTKIHQEQSEKMNTDQKFVPCHYFATASAPPPEPVLERTILLCSSPSTNSTPSSSSSVAMPTRRSAPLCCSSSCANLARICTTPFPIASSNSSNAICQIQSCGPTQLFDFLFLGSQNDALNADLLKRNNITRVINLSETCPRPEALSDDAAHFFRIPIKDSYCAKLLPHFDTAFDFIEEGRQSGEKILVHCLAGISRSPTLAIAYVMRFKGVGSDEAYKFVKALRPSISPNFNFLGQLMEYEKALRDRYVLPMQSLNGEKSSSSAANSLPNAPNLEDDSFNLAAKIEAQMKQGNQQQEGIPTARPRQLFNATCTARRSCPSDMFGTSPDIPSPSNEFSRLDISLSNPCFGMLPFSKIAALTTPNPRLAQNAAENPVFSLMNGSSGLHKKKLRLAGSVQSVSSSQCSSSASVDSSFSEEGSGFLGSITSTRDCLVDDNSADELQSLGRPSSERKNANESGDYTDWNRSEKRPPQKEASSRVPAPFRQLRQMHSHLMGPIAPHPSQSANLRAICAASKLKCHADSFQNFSARQRERSAALACSVGRPQTRTSVGGGCCLNRVRALGRRRNMKLAMPPSNLGKSLSSKHNDDIREEEEDEKLPCSDDDNANSGGDRALSRKKDSRQRQKSPRREVDRTSTSSTSSLEIAVQ